MNIHFFQLLSYCLVVCCDARLNPATNGPETQSRQVTLVRRQLAFAQEWCRFCPGNWSEFNSSVLCFTYLIELNMIGQLFATLKQYSTNEAIGTHVSLEDGTRMSAPECPKCPKCLWCQKCLCLYASALTAGFVATFNRFVVYPTWNRVYDAVDDEVLVGKFPTYYSW